MIPIEVKQRRLFLTQRLLFSPVFQKEKMTDEEREELFEREEVKHYEDSHKEIRMEVKFNEPFSLLYIDADFDDVKDTRSQLAIISGYFVDHGADVRQAMELAGLKNTLVPVFCWDGLDEGLVIDDDVTRRTAVSSVFATIGGLGLEMEK